LEQRIVRYHDPPEHPYSSLLTLCPKHWNTTCLSHNRASFSRRWDISDFETYVST
jgi:hypothetical protein